jgi:serine/threonine protein kinase
MDARSADPPAILTDYMSGGSLQSLIDLEQKSHVIDRWDKVQKLIVIYGISAGMFILHRNRIIHRDLKPDNILLNENLEPKVADFGLSKFVDPDKTMDQTEGRGTPRYMAPEIHMTLPYGWSVDVYAFGVLICATVSGRVPFQEIRSAAKLAQEVIAGARPKMPPDIAPEWRRLTEGCWDHDPNLRLSFEAVCRRLGGPEFTRKLTEPELARFVEYQQKVAAPGLTLSDGLITSLSSLTNIKQIGQGAFGKLYSATDSRTRKPVAVKILPKEELGGQYAAHFEREVDILASADHETLLGLRGYIPGNALTGEPPAILTDFMGGGSLQSLLDSGRKTDAVEKLVVLYGIAVGMMILHRNRIIHRDLSPDNFLLNKELEPKVADFGLSKFVDTANAMEQTIFGGTPRYMAPEIHEGHQYDWAVDVYAYGVLLYATIVGKEPYDGMTFPTASSFGIKVISGLRPAIPDDFDAKWQTLMKQCWDGEANARPKFEDICRRLGSREFMEGLDDAQASMFSEYRHRVSPPYLLTP